MQNFKFSVIIVTLNSGAELIETVNSSLSQKYGNFEIIIKDGLSSDNSISLLPNDDRIRIISQKDTGIYDAMNQAVGFSTGDFVVFMNTGDKFFDDRVLVKVNDFIHCYSYMIHDINNVILYGDCFTANRNSLLRYPEVFNDKVCFSKTLCHQATYYARPLFLKKRFSENYRITSDYDFYVSAYVSGVQFIHVPHTLVSYKGDGASETKKNRKQAVKEGKMIRKYYFSGLRYWKNWGLMQLNGTGIKQILVQQEWFYPIYKKIAELYYNHKHDKGNGAL